MAHRGPDASGVLSLGNVALGHRRLSIIDLDRRADQPFRRGSVALTYNGELYNYVELRQELISLGHQFETSSDTEVVVAAYQEWGRSSFKRMEGMWAIAIVDEDSQELLLCRDRFGEKPLVYSQTESSIAFSSEVRALRLLGLGKEVNRDTALEYLAFGRQVDPQETYFSGIRYLPAASIATVRLDDLSMGIENYYSIGAEVSFPTSKAVPFRDTFVEQFERAVRIRMRSDVPIAVSLSGGVDSSLIASAASAVARENGSVPPIGITACSGDSRNDESRYARYVATQLGMHWEPVPASPKDVQSQWARATRILEQPSAFSSPMHLSVVARASDLGIRVLLDGQGADEAWLGYQRHVYSLLGERNRLASFQRFLKANARQGMSPGYFLVAGLYFRLHQVALRRVRYRLAQIGVNVENEWLRSRFLASSASISSSKEHLQIDELGGEQLASLLRYTDRITMSHSIESRLPFLDTSVIRLALNAPTDVWWQDGWSKFILRQVLDHYGLSEIAWRQDKIGFEAPSFDFCSLNELWQEVVFASELLPTLGVRLRKDRDYKGANAWRLFSLALWEQEVLAS